MTGRRECELIEDRLPPLLENDLPAGELILVRAHLEDCAMCSESLENLRAISESIVHLRPADDWTALALARAKQAVSAETPQRSRMRSGLGVAITSALCVVLFFIGPPSGSTFTALADVPRALLADFAPIAARVPLPTLFAAPAPSTPDSKGEAR